MMVDAEDDLRVHLDEAPIAVIGKALVAAFAGQPDDRPIVEPEVQHGVHHPRHRDASSRAHRYQQRIAEVTKTCAERMLESSKAVGYLFSQLRWVAPAV